LYFLKNIANIINTYYDHNNIIMTINFVSRVSKIKNSKAKEYYVHRINIPSYVTKDLDLKIDDHIFIQAKKAEWYHMLEWDTMAKTWNKLPPNIKKQIIEDGLVSEVISAESLSDENESNVKPITISSASHLQYNIGSG
jgi:hypothetical protein